MPGDAYLPILPFDAADVDRAGERALERIRAGCEGKEGLAAKVGAALEAAFDLTAAEPHLADRLFGPSDRPGVLGRQESWRETFAAQLRAAAREEVASAAALPASVEPFLVVAIGVQAQRMAGEGRADQLGELIPELQAFVLGYYYSSAAEARAAAGLSRTESAGADPR